MNIRQRIALSFSSLLTILALVMVILIGYYIYLTLRIQAFDHLDTISHLESENVLAYFNGKEEFINNLAASSVFRDFLKESSGSADYKNQKIISEQRLDRTAASYKSPDLGELVLIDQNGVIVVSSDRSQEGLDKKSSDVFTKSKDKAYLRNIYISSVTKKPAYSVSAPIKDDKTGKFLGIVTARYDLSILDQILSDKIGLGKTGENFLVNSDKYFLTPSASLGDSVVLNKKVEIENVQNCFNPQDIAKDQNDPTYNPAGFYTDYRGIKIVGTHRYLPITNWCLITKIDSSEFFTPIVNIVSIVITTIVVGIIIFVLLGFVVAGRITKPIEQLQSGIEKIISGDLDYKVGIPAKDEIGQLSRSFDGMVNSIKESRMEIDARVKEQTNEITNRGQDIEDQRKAILNILEDVDGEKDKVSEEKSKSEALLASIGDGVVAADQDGRIILMNQAAEQMLGWSAKQALGKLVIDMWKVLDEKGNMVPNTKRPFILAFAGKTIITTTTDSVYSYVRKDGTSFPVSIAITPVKVNNRIIGVIDVFRDITHDKDVDKMKIEFISLASHQLRTPLSAMKWFGEMLLNGDAGKLSKEQNEYVQNIYQSNERMIALVNGLLNTSRIESGRIIIDPKPTNLGDLVNDVIKEIKNTIDTKKQNLIISVHPQLPKINIDPNLVREVYKNLLTNAIKYTPEKGEISVFISKKGEEIISQVSDTGYGILKDEQNRIYEKFFRGTNILKFETEGTGLGLYLAKAIVESSGGRIWFESSQKGTTFWFSLPFQGTKPKEGEVSIDS